MSGYKLSHSNRRTKRRWLPNLQEVRVVGEEGIIKKIRVCASCIRSGKVKKGA